MACDRIIVCDILDGPFWREKDWICRTNITSADLSTDSNGARRHAVAFWIHGLNKFTG